MSMYEHGPGVLSGLVLGGSWTPVSLRPGRAQGTGEKRRRETTVSHAPRATCIALLDECPGLIADQDALWLGGPNGRRQVGSFPSPAGRRRSPSRTVRSGGRGRPPSGPHACSPSTGAVSCAALDDCGSSAGASSSSPSVSWSNTSVWGRGRSTSTGSGSKHWRQRGS